MLWVSFATIIGKMLSFVSQIALGYLLAVEVYAVFALAAGAMALIGGFQNASVSKHLVRNRNRFEELFPQCSGFTFQFGIIGALILVGVGGAFSKLYSMPELFGVLLLTSLSVPLIAVNTTLVASLSIGYSFREINLSEALKSVAYYTTLVAAAYLGSGIFTVAIATVVGAVVAHLLLRGVSGHCPDYFRFNLREFRRIAFDLRWILLSGFLFALAIRADYFVLWKVLPVDQMGFYAFAFMLVTSLTIPVSAGINQVFLPIFSSLQADLRRLRHEVVRFSSVIVILGSFLCLGILGVSSTLVHLAWGGKWDAAAFVINILVAVMPLRFLSTISGVGLESTGHWRMRNMLLLLEFLLLASLALVGAVFWGLTGAILGVVLQRGLSGIVNFCVLGKVVGSRFSASVLSMLRLYVPFYISVGILFGFSYDRHISDATVAGLGLASVETLVTFALFAGLTSLLSRDFSRATFEFLMKKVKR
jgi:O-antigen/teichoic acid export membrane protein